MYTMTKHPRPVLLDTACAFGRYDHLVVKHCLFNVVLQRKKNCKKHYRVYMMRCLAIFYALKVGPMGRTVMGGGELPKWWRDRWWWLSWRLFQRTI
jgi:hypothetical protein